jgi:hypothetical protein
LEKYCLCAKKRYEIRKRKKKSKKAKRCSLDLREKVMAYIKEGKRKMEAVKVFRLNRKTISRWEKR